MKDKRSLIFYLGIMLVCCSVFLLLFYLYLNYKQEKIYNNAIRNVLDEKSLSENQEETTKLDDALDEPIELLEADQQADGVSEYKSVMKIEVDNFSVIANIYDGTDKDKLNKGLGRYTTTKEVGELGNCCVAGHSSVTYNCLLNGIETIPNLSLVQVWDKNGIEHKYYIIKRQVVEPTDLYVLNTIDDTKSIFTIITCTNKGKQRLVFTCLEMDDETLAKYRETYDSDIRQDISDMITSYLSKFNLYEYLCRERSG